MNLTEDISRAPRDRWMADSAQPAPKPDQGESQSGSSERHRRRLRPNRESVAGALQVVRALDPASYQALLTELGLEPDPRLSVPGCARPAGR